MTPLVTIIIPCFNRAGLIPETLDSVLAQTYPHWEAIVVDDGSIDNSLQVVTGYCEKDKRIKLLERDREPKNASVCRNIGIENARGEYLIFLDSDDLLTPTCLAGRVEYMQNNPGLDFAVFQMEAFDHRGILPNSKYVRKKENYLYAYLRHDLPWAITCPFWKTDFVEKKLKGYNEQYPRLQDPEFNTRALLVEDLQFNVLHHFDADCLCRNHTAKTFNTLDLLFGFKLYISEFILKIKTRNDELVCRNQLKKCIIEAVRNYYTYKKENFDKVSNCLMVRIVRENYCAGLIRFRTLVLCQILALFYILRINKIIFGFYILRLTMKLIKISG